MLKIVVLLGLALVYSKASIQATQPTDEQQCQGWRRNSNKKAPRLAKDAGLFLFMEGLEGLTHRSFSLRAGCPRADNENR